LCAIIATFVLSFSACGGSLNSGDNQGSDSSSGGNTIGGLLGGGKSSSRETVKEDPDAPDRDNTPVVLANNADGSAGFDGNGAFVDYSNADDGYIMAKYQGDNKKIKLQITKDGGDTYTYDVWPNTDYSAFPLSQGSGLYNIAMFLNIEGDKYSQACAHAIQADITNEFSPFLRPNQYCYFTDSTEAVAKGAELAQGSKSDMKVIEKTFFYLIDNITYDYVKAATVQSGYLPDVDETLSTGTGICFDYASLMTCMLRSQRIPCQLVIGYAGTAYHAWISVNVEGVGWVANMIQFNNDKWTFMDPTFAASGDNADPNVIGDGERYNPVYYY